MDPSSDLCCELCESEVKASDRYCPACGSVFDEYYHCAAHPDQQAEGVCVICSTPCCRLCGGWKQKHFFCDAHSRYELIENMVRIYVSRDALSLHYAGSCLEQAGLHPFLYPPYFDESEPFSEDGTLGRYGSLSRSSSKILVPLSEVREAERILRELTLIE